MITTISRCSFFGTRNMRAGGASTEKSSRENWGWLKDNFTSVFVRCAIYFDIRTKSIPLVGWKTQFVIFLLTRANVRIFLTQIASFRCVVLSVSLPSVGENKKISRWKSFCASPYKLRRANKEIKVKMRRERDFRTLELELKNEFMSVWTVNGGRRKRWSQATEQNGQEIDRKFQCFSIR